MIICALGASGSRMEGTSTARSSTASLARQSQPGDAIDRHRTNRSLAHPISGRTAFPDSFFVSFSVAPQCCAVRNFKQFSAHFTSKSPFSGRISTREQRSVGSNDPGCTRRLHPKVGGWICAQVEANRGGVCEHQGSFSALIYATFPQTHLWGYKIKDTFLQAGSYLIISCSFNHWGTSHVPKSILAVHSSKSVVAENIQVPPTVLADALIALVLKEGRQHSVFLFLLFYFLIFFYFDKRMQFMNCSLCVTFSQSCLAQVCVYS